MPEIDAALNVQHAAEIVAVFLRHNKVDADQLPSLLRAVHETLARLGTPVEPAFERAPAVPIRRSAGRDFVICLDDGWKGMTLRRHIAAAHGVTAEEYRARWSLRLDHPVTAPAYSQRRSAMAKQLGLGRLGRAAADASSPASLETAKPASRSRRRGRPRKTPEVAVN